MKMKARNRGSVYNRCNPYIDCKSIAAADDYMDVYERMHYDFDDEKNKTVIVSDPSPRTVLQVMIGKAEGLDNHVRHPSVSNRHYKVVYWVEPDKDEEQRTDVSYGCQSPQWDHKGTFLFKSPDDCAYLHVEVHRFNSRVDPGPSSGRVVVGRVRIPLPKEFNRVKKRFYPLVRVEGGSPTHEGKIFVGMKLEKIY